MNEDTFSTWFKQQLAKKDMSAGEFAERARISRAASYFYVQGKRVPNQATLVKIASALEVPVASVPTYVVPTSEESNGTGTATAS